MRFSWPFRFTLWPSPYTSTRAHGALYREELRRRDGLRQEAGESRASLRRPHHASEGHSLRRLIPKIWRYGKNCKLFSSIVIIKEKKFFSFSSIGFTRIHFAFLSPSLPSGRLTLCEIPTDFLCKTPRRKPPQGRSRPG